LKPRVVFLFLAAGFVYGVIHLFALRFEAGDVYPEYSSLRADPLGLKGFYDALDELPHMEVRRNYRPLPRLHVSAPTTLLYAGTAHHAVWGADELRAAEGLLTDGARIVIAFFPLRRPPSERELEKEKDGEKEDGSKKTSSSDDKPSANDDEPETAGMRSFPEVAERWGFSFNYLPQQTESARVAVCETDAPPGLEPRLSWHSALSFIPDANEWNVIYRCDGEPVVMERPYNRGHIVVAADSFFLSNEALRSARTPAFLDWLLGDSQVVVFDEESHNIRAEPGVMYLARKYHLHALGAGLLLLVFLFVWKNASPLVPALEDGESNLTAAVVGKRSEEGFVNLLRRSIPQRDLVRVCAEEWRRAFDPRHRDERANEIIAAAENDAGKAARGRHLIDTYRAISRTVAEKKFPISDLTS